MMKKKYRERKQKEEHAGGSKSFKELKEETEKRERMKQTPSNRSEVIQKMIISC